MSQSDVAGLLVAPLRLDDAKAAKASLIEARRLASESGITSFIVFGGERAAFPDAVRSLEEAARGKVLLFSDLERGCGQQISGATELPPAMAIGATRSTALAERCGEHTAREAAALGIRVVLAPVLDVNVNPRNPIINTRAFGGDPEGVSAMGAAFADGVRRGGCIPTAKHFPGHGDTSQDSHLETPVVAATEDAMQRVHLRPFASAIKAGLEALMVGHVAVPSLDGGRVRPATASRAILDDWLRRRLGFRGVAMTDALIMRGAVSSGETAVSAIESGCDLALYPSDCDAAITSLERALRTGRIARTVLDASLSRLATLRRLAEREVEPPAEDGDALAREVAEAAITLVNDSRGLVPIQGRAARSLELVIVADAAGSRCGAFEAALRARYPSVTCRTLPARDVSALGEPTGIRIVAGFGSPRGFRPEIPPIPPPSAPRHVLVSMGSPYLFGASRPGTALVCAYGDAPFLADATARAIAGEIEFRGRLPVAFVDESRE